MKQHTHSDSLGCPPTIGHEPLLVSCFRCDELHPTHDPLSFSPICPICAGNHPLGSLGMIGTHRLTHAEIDGVLTRKSPGNYALGYMDGDTFVVFYVGRSDSDVKRRLHRWVDTPSRYSRYAPPGKAAWGSHLARVLPLGAPVLQRVGACADSRYTHFAFSYAPSAEAAFAKELRNFGDFGGSNALDNQSEPRAGS